jgi:hypothetical protein
VTRRRRTLLSSGTSETDALAIAVRAYVPLPQSPKPGRKPRRNRDNASEWSLVFDTETATDAAQALRFGTYQVWKGAVLRQAGIFSEPSLSDEEKSTLAEYAATHGLKLMPTREFVESIFYGIAYEYRATIIGFNLPFDISRLAVNHGSARGKAMRGGFSFQLSEDRYKLRVQVKHLSARAALIQFTKPRRRFDTKGMRRRGLPQPVRRGTFIDVKTIAAALTSRSFSLGKLADFLETEHRKLATDDHGAPITPEYIGYAANDVQVTWECYQKLAAKFEEHKLTETRLSQILSEAGIGKGYLKQMGIQPWRALQADFPDWLIGIIISSYYGGRSEVHLRRVITQVLYCDFLSMYPTVCTLMGLFRFVIGKGVTWRDSTGETRRLLESVSLADLRDPETWRSLATLVKVIPDEDIFPLRAKYDGPQATIGLNHLTADFPLWFTLADCIAAKLLTGKAPRIIEALTFEPGEMQSGLNSIAIAGNPAFRIDPSRDDFYRRLIDLRSETKARLASASGAEAARLKSEEQALKIIANATSYGIFVEVNVSDLDEREQRQCFGPKGEPFAILTDKSEEPGRYFHPLLASLITGAARLMLAITETLAIQAGIDWAFCDTDSMALAKPEGMGREAFLEAAQSICDWFSPLNPYERKSRLLKVEDANLALDRRGSASHLADLFCLAISAKRYALFNLDAASGPIIRKASAHGLGHLLPPYSEAAAPSTIPAPRVPVADIGVARWQHDHWHQIILPHLEGHPDQVDLSYHPALTEPAASRYAATTPELLSWFRKWNEDRPYRGRVKPFNFLLAFQARPFHRSEAECPALQPGVSRRGRPRRSCLPKPIAPFDSDLKRASAACFDRETGKPVPPSQLKTYRQALAQYHLSPEPKFLGAEHLHAGPTRRRHVRATLIEHIGKEADRWEEQFHLGLDEDAQIEYGSDADLSDRILKELNKSKIEFSLRKLADISRISRNHISAFRKGQIELSPDQLRRISAAMLEFSRFTVYRPAAPGG